MGVVIGVGLGVHGVERRVGLGLGGLAGCAAHGDVDELVERQTRGLDKVTDVGKLQMRRALRRQCLRGRDA